MTNTLYILNETYTNGYNLLALNLFSLSSVLCAISVIISKNPIVSVLFLIGLFLSIASYLITIGINFIGLSYLLVYVGAVSILFLFILMLINVRISELFSDTKNSIPLVFIVAILFSSLLSLILPHNTTLFTVMGFKLNVFNKYTNYLNKIYELYSNELYYATTNIWDNNISEANDISSLGNTMYTTYAIWLIMTALILAVAMVGAIVITIKPKTS